MKTMKGWISTGHKRACFTSQKHHCTCENAAEGRGGGSYSECAVKKVSQEADRNP